MSKFIIKKLWAVISIDDDGDEGVCAWPLAGGSVLMPLVASDPERLGEIRYMAQQLAQMNFADIKIVRFDNITVEDVF